MNSHNSLPSLKGVFGQFRQKKALLIIWPSILAITLEAILWIWKILCPSMDFFATLILSPIIIFIISSLDIFIATICYVLDQYKTTTDNLPDNIKISSLLSRFDHFSESNSKINSLLRDGIKELVSYKIDDIELNLKQLTNLRVEFQKAHELLKVLRFLWMKFMLNYEHIHFFSIEWIPVEGNFPSTCYEEIYYKIILDSLIKKGIVKRFFAHTTRFDSLGSLEASFLEEKTKGFDTETITYLNYTTHNIDDLIYCRRDEKYNLLIALHQINETDEIDFIVKIGMDPDNVGSQGIVSVNSDDLKKAKKYINDISNKSGVNFEVEVVQKEMIENKSKDTADGKVVAKILENLDNAKQSVWATDVTGCIPEDSIELWERSVFYRKIKELTETVAKKLFYNKEKGVIRIFIVKISDTKKRSTNRKYLLSFAEKKHIHTRVINLSVCNNHLSIFPFNKITDFHVIDESKGAQIDIGPSQPFSMSELFALPAGKKRLLQQSESEKEKYFKQFILDDVEIYIKCFKWLLENSHEISSKEDINRFLDSW